MTSIFPKPQVHLRFCITFEAHDITIGLHDGECWDTRGLILAVHRFAFRCIKVYRQPRCIVRKRSFESVLVVVHAGKHNLEVLRLSIDGIIECLQLWLEGLTPRSPRCSEKDSAH